MDQNFDRPLFPKFESPWVGDLPYMLKNCGPSASVRAGGRAAHAGWPPWALARQPPSCAVLAWPDRVPASFWFTRSEPRRLHASSRGVPLGTVRLRTATRTKACDPLASSPPLPFSGGEERWARRPAGRACARGRGHVTLGTARLRTGGEEECTGTADTNPGCNYLVRGYSPSMHYFWRGDMPHFSSPLPFQRGARGCRAAAVPRPPRMARRRPRPARAGQSRSRATAVPRPLRPAGSCTPSISAGMAPLAGASQRTPLQTGGQPGAARAAQVRRGVTAAISIWPAAPAAGQPQQVWPLVAGGLAPFSHYFWFCSQRHLKIVINNRTEVSYNRKLSTTGPRLAISG